MKEHVEKLYDISKKETRKIIGLMSGTSLDGLDIAVCSIHGHGHATQLHIEKFKTLSYTDDFRKEVLEIFSKRDSDLQQVCVVNNWLAKQHAQMINSGLSAWGIAREEIDLIASHGQTIYHAPKHLHPDDKFNNSTLQIGDGDHIAVDTGIITISDFRQKHIAAGGEGAPLAAYGDVILFSDPEKDIILLNIGGIANFTLLPAGNKTGIFSTDVGPGNTLMDAWMRKYHGGMFDENAIIAKKGTVIEPMLNALKDNEFFKIPFPRTTGPELFSLQYVEQAINKTAGSAPHPEDVMATLNMFTASVICESINLIPRTSYPLEIFLSGGGMHNPLVTDYIKDNIHNASIATTANKNIDPDAKEAVLFALLANECVAGDKHTFHQYFPNTSMGKISFPG